MPARSGMTFKAGTAVTVVREPHERGNQGLLIKELECRANGVG